MCSRIPFYGIGDIADRIVVALLEMDGDEVAKLHNQICDCKVIHKGDCVFIDECEADPC